MHDQGVGGPGDSEKGSRCSDGETGRTDNANPKESQEESTDDDEDDYNETRTVTRSIT